ncbi:hypothetical protein PAECIP111893_01733 [Paenibacillus plantiphilus]|uniref:VOC domain-containing protein n=1 Tax=Paenibacillus plantiphilus TaxID=2905650 RepID=A0ABN8GB73_9BACL|nr:hypothetical protein [Paenibacillus plantiphilus]CAH1201808.1 hypothetical protein PAECIP111893_01733 [Paenibacillus plantiphilus]
MLKLQCVTLLTPMLEQQKIFYTQVIGLPILNDCTDAFTVKIGHSHLKFERSTIAGASPFYHFAFDILGNKLDEATVWLNARGIALNGLPQHTDQFYSATWNSTSIYFYDPAGNIVEFIARHNFNHSSMDPFTTDSLLNISEIGLVVHHVPAASELLRSYFSIDGYKDSNDSFAAVGDEDGLFILSADQRVWLGSNKKAGVYKTEVVIEGAGNKGELLIEGYPYKITAC